MQITVIVVSYNQEKTILETLESIKYQVCNFGNEIQLVISDDGSQDETYCLIEKWLDINRTLFLETILLPSDKNRGTVANLVRCYPYIGGDYYVILAGDDLLAKESVLSRLQNKDIYICGDFLFRDYRIFPKINNYIKYLFWESSNEDLLRLSKFLFPFDSQTWVFSKRLEHEALYKEMKKYKYLDDIPMWDFFFNNIKDIKVGYINIPIKLHRLSEQGISNEKNEVHKPVMDDLYIFRKSVTKSMKGYLNKYIAKVYELQTKYYNNFLLRQILQLLNPCEIYIIMRAKKRREIMKKLAFELDEKYLQSNQLYLEEIHENAAKIMMDIN